MPGNKLILELLNLRKLLGREEVDREGWNVERYLTGQFCVVIPDLVDETLLNRGSCTGGNNIGTAALG